jgi:hypothetical protein
MTVFFTSLLFSVQAQKNNQQILDENFAKNTEIYFTFQIFDREEIPVLTKIISIDNVKEKTVYAYANRTEFGKFLDLGYSYTILQHPGTLLSKDKIRMGEFQKAPNFGTTWNFYPTYPQYVTYMQNFALNYPSICRLDTIGTTTQGRLLLAVKLSDSVNVNRGKPEFLYTSTIHGDETCGYILMLHLIDSLLSGYGSIPRITNLLNNYQIYINPLANPDGTYTGGNNSVYGAQRYNANGVDLNRNFPDPEAGPHPDGNQWQMETKAFMHYDTIHHFVMSTNYHGGSEVVNYPWDTWAKLHADNSWFHFVSREYADTVHLHSPVGYMTELDNGVTDGYAWYQITGGRQDYTTYFHYGREVTIELSYIKLLPTDSLLRYWNYNKRSFLNYIEESAYGINGQVTDTVTGTPLNAKIMITGHDIDNSWEFSNSSNGLYYRPIFQGTWALTYTCSGYFAKTIHGINVTNRNTTLMNVKLVPIDYGIKNETQKAFTFVYPNPSNGNVHILLPESGNITFSYSVYNITGQLLQSGTLNGLGDKIFVPLDLSPLKQGIYLMRLSGGKKNYENKIVIQ